MTETKQIQVNNPWMLELLQIIFIVLKLNPGGHLDSAVQDWPWWVVFIPMWASVAFVLVIILVWLLGMTVYTFLIEPIVIKRRRKRVWKRLQEQKARKPNRLR